MQIASELNVTKTKESPGEVSESSLFLLFHRGWVMWKCGLFDGEIITIARDGELVNDQMELDDERQAATRYPVFTVAELRELKSKSDEMIFRIIAVKKIAQAKILLEKYDGIEGEGGCLK